MLIWAIHVDLAKGDCESLFRLFASGANYNVDGTVMYRETGCQGVERPLTSSAASGSIGNVAPLPTYKVCTLLCADKSSVLIIYLASCPALPDSCNESGRTDSDRGDHCSLSH
jgi:hypothetical protein